MPQPWMPPSWLSQSPAHWDDYLPDPSDFATTEEWVAAMESGALDTSAPLAGGWVNSRVEREPEFAKNAQFHPAATERSSGIDNLNWIFNQSGDGQRHMRLKSYIANHPDVARAAYMAHDEFGNPLVDPAILAMIERQLGIGPQAVVSDNPPSLTVDPGHGGFNPPEAGGGVARPMPGAPEAGGGTSPGMRAEPQPVVGATGPIGVAQPPGGGFNPAALQEWFGMGGGPQQPAPAAMNAPAPGVSTIVPGIPDDVVTRIRQRFGRGPRGARAGGLGPY